MSLDCDRRRAGPSGFVSDAVKNEFDAISANFQICRGSGDALCPLCRKDSESVRGSAFGLPGRICLVAARNGRRGTGQLDRPGEYVNHGVTRVQADLAPVDAHMGREEYQPSSRCNCAFFMTRFDRTLGRAHTFGL